MSKQVTMRAKIQRIVRRYKKITPYKFLYNRKSDLQRRANRIQCWVLLYSENVGYSIFCYFQQRNDLLSVAEWRAKWNNSVDNHPSLYSILTQSIIPAINNRPTGKGWHFKSLLCWTGAGIDIRPSKNRDKSGKYKSAKKRKQSNHDPNRR